MTAETHEVAPERTTHPLLRLEGVTKKYGPNTVVDSLDMTAEDRELIHQAVWQCPDNYILITHGTDTMTETAALLGDISDKTIVLTGALNPARFRGSDAIFNIGGAVAAVQSLGPGVYIFMNGRVFKAGSVRKNREKNRFEEI